jgi:ABC-type sugar transport system permease subunit
VFIAPAALLIVATILTPIVMSGWISLHSWSLLTPIGDMQWVGFDNYTQILRDPTFMRALNNTLVFAAAIVGIGIPLAILLAVLIHQGRVRGRGVVLTVLFTTYVIPTVAVALIWGYLLSPRGGPVNELLNLVGIPAQPWLGHPRTALWSLVLLTVWQYLGYFTTLLVAGLTQIPSDLYEASDIDGASATRKLRNITLPLLKRPLTFAIAICLINSLGVFDAVAVLTRGGPSDSTNVVTFHAVRTAFDFGQAGRAAAMTMVLLVAVVVAVGGVLLYSRDMDDVP